MSSKLRLLSVIGLAALWLVAVELGHKSMEEYEATPAKAMTAPQEWPAECSLSHRGWTIVMAVHPRCPCTRASQTELNRLLVKCKVPVKSWLLFYRPANSGPDWSRSDTWKSASLIANATVVDDPGGEQAELFGAETSGEVLLYGPDGRLRFHGGITDSRGQEGDNTGEDSIVRIINTNSNETATSNFFGCSIR